MVTLPDLWLPILLSAVLVFILSSFIHMALPWHRNDYRKLPNEDEVLAGLRPHGIAPGDYAFPSTEGISGNPMSDPEFVQKYEAGPVGFVTFAPPGHFNMGKSLSLWFLKALLISILAGYACSRAIGPTSDYANVFQIVGTVAITGYAFGRWQHAIWYGYSWKTTLKSTVDGILYGLVTAGTFGWLWPVP